MNRIIAVLSLSTILISNAYAAGESVNAPPPPAPPASATAVQVSTTTAPTPVPAPACTAISIVINFNIDAPTYAQVKNEFDDRFYKLDGFVKEHTIQKFSIQSMTYNLRLDSGNQYHYQSGAASQPTAPSYHLAGSAEYQTDSSENAFKLGQFLTQQKFEVTVSNKVGRNNPCNTPPASTPNNKSQPTYKHSDTGSSGVKNDKDTLPVLKEKPPSEEKAPSDITMPSQNGAAPDLPGLNDEPPDAEPYQQKR